MISKMYSLTRFMAIPRKCSILYYFFNLFWFFLSSLVSLDLPLFLPAFGVGASSELMLSLPSLDESSSPFSL